MCVKQHITSRNVSDGVMDKHAHLFTEYKAPWDSSYLPEEMDWRTSGAVSHIKDQVCVCVCVCVCVTVCISFGHLFLYLFTKMFTVVIIYILDCPFFMHCILLFHLLYKS